MTTAPFILLAVIALFAWFIIRSVDNEPRRVLILIHEPGAGSAAFEEAMDDTLLMDYDAVKLVAYSSSASNLYGLDSLREQIWEFREKYEEVHCIASGIGGFLMMLNSQFIHRLVVLNAPCKVDYGGASLSPARSHDRGGSIWSLWSIDCPTLVLHGTEDDVVPLGHTEALEDMGALVCTFQGKGHNWFHVEQHTVMPSIERFLTTDDREDYL